MARPCLRRELRTAFWQLVAAGVSTERAALSVGVSRATGYRWFAASGGVIPPRAVRDPAAPTSPHGPGRHGRRLQMADREEIAHLRRLGRSVSQIAEEVGFHKATISRELRRNTCGRGYRASTAQAAADLRAGRNRPAKLAVDTRLRAEVERRLAHNESPAQISHRLMLDFPDDPEMRVSHETIYQSLYV